VPAGFESVASRLLRSRSRLLEGVRDVLVEGAEPQPRVAALAALLSGSGTLPQFHHEIPWTSPVITRAKELEQGDWGAGAAAEAVARTVTATIVNNVIIAATVLPRSWGTTRVDLTTMVQG
jgi:hypothetical protein